MAIRVGTIRTIGRIALCLAAPAYCLYILAPGALGDLAPSSPQYALHICSGYGLTFLGFVAFPETRRSDLVKIVILASVLTFIARAYLGLGFNLFLIFGDIVGALGAISPRLAERLRSLCRADPNQIFSMAHPGDRRRKTSSLRRPQSLSDPVSKQPRHQTTTQT